MGQRSKKSHFFYVSLLIVEIIVSLSIHLWTAVIVGKRLDLAAGIALFILPVLSEIGVFLLALVSSKTICNTYCLVVLVYAACVIVIEVICVKLGGVGLFGFFVMDPENRKNLK